jgi:ABC-type transport system involved in multi-copper enzyme maturation permease subunit
MILLPVADREMRTAARRPATHWTRTGAAAAAIVVAVWVVWVQTEMAPARIGQSLFSILSGLAFAVALFSGVAFTSDCISSERREGTLGLLFLTDLRTSDIIAGKLAASSLGALYGIIATLPVLAIPLLLGGVTLGEYLRTVLTLLNTLFWSLSAAMFVSTFRAEAQEAAGRSLALILALAGVFPAVGGMVGGWLSSRSWANEDILLVVSPLLALSPGTAFAGGFASLFSSSPKAFFGGNAVVLVSWIVFLAWAGRRLPKAWQNETLGPSRKTPWFRRRETTTGDAGVARRTELLENGPFVWLVCRRRLRVAMPWLALGITVAAWIALGLWIGGEFFAGPAFMGLSVVLHLFLKIIVSAEAPRQIFDDRRAGAMELLLTLPIPDAEHVLGHTRALLRLYRRPVVVVLVLDLVLMLGAEAGARDNDIDSPGWIQAWLFRDWLLVLDLLAISAFGLWHGASTRRTRLNGLPFAVVVILPSVLLGGLFIVLASSRSGTATPSGMLWTWWLAGTFWSAILVWCSRDRLRREFREAAAVPPGTKPTLAHGPGQAGSPPIGALP